MLLAPLSKCLTKSNINNNLSLRNLAEQWLCRLWDSTEYAKMNVARSDCDDDKWWFVVIVMMMKVMVKTTIRLQH